MSQIANKRSDVIDIVKGILIILVVCGHYENNIVHDIIFLFHMPLFFVVSGYLLDRNKIKSKDYIKGKVKCLMTPYIVYMFLETVFVRKSLGIECNIKDYFRLLWGGRAIAGVHWYITCFLAAVAVFSFLVKRYPDHIVKGLILMGGGIAIFESHLMDDMTFLKAPGIPLNLDVSLLALVYIGLGFFYKEVIKCIENDACIKLDIIGCICGIGIVMFCCVNYQSGSRYYYFDMKSVYYKELFSAILIPCCFGMALLRVAFWISHLNALRLIKQFLLICGKTTIPIMFMHLPLNCMKDTVNYGIGLYVAIGVGIPLLLSLVFGNSAVLRTLFGFSLLGQDTK